MVTDIARGQTGTEQWSNGDLQRRTEDTLTETYPSTTSSRLIAHRTHRGLNLRVAERNYPISVRGFIRKNCQCGRKINQSLYDYRPLRRFQGKSGKYQSDVQLLFGINTKMGFDICEYQQNYLSHFHPNCFTFRMTQVPILFDLYVNRYFFFV